MYEANKLLRVPYKRLINSTNFFRTMILNNQIKSRNNISKKGGPREFVKKTPWGTKVKKCTGLFNSVEKSNNAFLHFDLMQITKNTQLSAFAPIFRNRLRDRGFREEAPAVSIECYVLGNPTPEISWYHQGSLLTEDGKHKIERQGEFCKLTVVNPMYMDGGEYSCVATNSLGTDECSCRILSGGKCLSFQGS
jgi:hypothetical protein